MGVPAAAAPGLNGMLDRAAKAVVVAVVLSVVIIAGWGSGATAIGGRLGGDYPEFHGAGRIVRQGDGHRLYDPVIQARSQRDLFPPGEPPGHLDFAYPPVVAAAYAPLSLLPYRLSYAVHTGLLMAALAVALRLLSPAVDALRRRPWVVYALALSAYPMFRAVGAGQNTALTVLAVAAWWRWRWDGRPFLAGLAAGALLYKPQFAVLFLVAVVLDRSLPAQLGALTSGLALWLASAAVAGVGWMGDFVAHAVDLPSMEQGVVGTSSVSLPHAVQELLGSGAAATAVAVAAAAACGVAALVVWVRRRGLDAPYQLRAVGALAAAAVLVPPHVIFYDAGLLVLAGAGLAAAGGRWDRSGWLALYLASFSGALAGALGFNPLVLVALAALAATLRSPGRDQALVSASRA